MTDDDRASALDVIDGLQRRLATLRRHVAGQLRDAALTAGRLDLLACRVGDEAIALPLAPIERVALRCALTPIPTAPTPIAGLLDLHGDLLPALDLGALLFGPRRTPQGSDLMVVCRDEERRAALLVAAVLGVWRDQPVAAADAVDAVPHAAYLVGISQLDGRATPVLGVSQLLSAVSLPAEAGS